MPTKAARPGKCPPASAELLEIQYSLAGTWSACAAAPPERTQPRRHVDVHDHVSPGAVEARNRARIRFPRGAEATRQVGAALAADVAPLQGDHVALELHATSSAALRVNAQRQPADEPRAALRQAQHRLAAAAREDHVL